jgi:hypothetical protein
MAFEQVFLRLPDGRQFGPVPFAQLGQWHAEGRVTLGCYIVDAATGEARPAGAFPMLAVPPPVVGSQPTPTAPSGFDKLIPTKNVNALVGYYISIVSLLCCIPCGPAAIVLGILGLKNVAKTGVGKAHAIVALVIGSITTLTGIALIIWSVVAGKF